MPAHDEEHDQADHRAQVEAEAAAADRRDDPPEEVEVGVGRLGDEVEHRPQRRVVGHARDPRDQHPDQDQDDVDEEERRDVVGDVLAGDREQDHPRILSSEARTAASKASRAPSRSSASSPASVLPPGEVTATRTSAGRRMRISAAGACGGLDDQLLGQLLVQAGVGAGVGERLGHQGEVRGRAAHHRGGDVELRVGQLDDRPENAQLLSDLRAELPGNAEHAAAHLHRDVGHDPADVGVGECSFDFLQRGRSQVSRRPTLRRPVRRPPAQERPASPQAPRHRPAPPAPRWTRQPRHQAPRPACEPDRSPDRRTASAPTAQPSPWPWPQPCSPHRQKPTIIQRQPSKSPATATTG